MGSSEDLMQRLAVSKKIMDKQENIRRGSDSVRNINSPMVESFDTTNAVYNLPTEMLENQSERKSEFDPTKPLNQDKIIFDCTHTICLICYEKLLNSILTDVVCPFCRGLIEKQEIPAINNDLEV